MQLKDENFNGCIIADSVGLGKTFSALAIIKYYELELSVLVPPQKTRDNWLVYTMNDKGTFSLMIALDMTY